MEWEFLVRLLAFAGLVIAAALYFLLIRRRRRAVDDEQARVSDESLRRGLRRLRRLNRYDEP
ncbi:MAG: hypothetical protein M3Y40_00660 [Chloroflexota bacterium]|nr:hypothetical protein [Chloroflexota bacterium]